MSVVNRGFLLRRAFDGMVAGLPLIAFAFGWLGNTAHERAGVVMFLLALPATRLMISEALLGLLSQGGSLGGGFTVREERSPRAQVRRRP